MNYSPHTQKDKKQMLDAIGVASVEDLLKAIPQQFRLQKLDLPEGISELELKALLSEKAARNRSTHELTSFLGAGAYEHYIPQVVEAVISRGEFLTRRDLVESADARADRVNFPSPQDGDDVVPRLFQLQGALDNGGSFQASLDQRHGAGLGARPGGAQRRAGLAAVDTVGKGVEAEVAGRSWTSHRTSV